jgi:hypothetical protein
VWGGVGGCGCVWRVLGGDVTFAEHSSETSGAKGYGFGAMHTHIHTRTHTFVVLGTEHFEILKTGQNSAAQKS